MTKLSAFLVNYNYEPRWLLDSSIDYIIVDRSDSPEYLKDFPQDRIYYDANVGQVDYPKLNYLVNNYDNLPDVFLWGKTNLFKYITEEEWDKVKDNQHFTPLLTQNHRTYTDAWGPVNFYCDGMYYERAEICWKPPTLVWYDFYSYPQWARSFNLPDVPFIPFAPGGNYILTKETVHRYPKEYYQMMANTLPHAQLPMEAYFCERSYYNMWK